MQKRTLLLTVAATAGLTALGPVFAETRGGSGRKLIAGMDAAYPPFGSRDSKTGEYVGFDVDVIKAVGRAEGVEVEVRNLAFDGLIPALQSGSIDFAINDIAITHERAQSVGFSRRYFIAGLGVVVNARNTTIHTAKDLEGRVLAASIGSTGEEAARKIKGAKIRVFNQLNECFLELINGGVDAVVSDIASNDYFIAHAGRGRVKALPVTLLPEDVGIAVKKENQELLRLVNAGLAKIIRSGEFTAIYRKWFGHEPPAALLKS